MFDDELPEHAALALTHAREEFLRSLRGQSDTYDRIRALARRFMKASGAPERLLPEVEGLLVLQMIEDRAEATRDERKAVEAAKRGERVALRMAIDKALGDRE